MAVAEIRPDWTIGTLTLTSGSKNFTTAGSALQTAAIQSGDEIITRSGNVLIIDTITGQNSGTLMENCPAAAAGAAQPLRIRFQPDGSRYNGATADLVQLLGSGNVYEFAGLDGSSGGVPVFTGTGTMDVGDYVADPNGSLGKLAAITLAANKLLNTNAAGDLIQSDITALGRAILALTGTNGNIPVMTGAGTVARRPIVGAVSQSGGIPTGAILESGSNSNGHYKKRADGTMMCRGFASAPCSTASGSVFISDYLQFIFPAAFVAVPYIAYGVERTAGNGVVWPVASSADLSQTGVSCRGAAAISGAWARIYYIAEGRWF